MAILTIKTERDERGNIIARYTEEYFTYNVSVTALAAGASLTGQIQIEASSDFIWLKTAYFADIAGGAQTDSSRVIPLVNVAITDGGSAKNLQNSPTPIASLAGTEGLPFNLSLGYTFAANSNVSFTFTNRSAATTYANVVLSLIGYRRNKYAGA